MEAPFIRKPRLVEVIMESLADTLYPPPDYRRTPLSLLRWWEGRRWMYNKAVGTAGVVTLVGVLVLHPDRGDLFAPGLVAAVGVYGLLANACYTLGWLAEMAARAVWGADAPDMGPLLFREGLIFSVGVTLLPLFAMAIFAVLRAIALPAF